jgi:hypothetical protein
MMMMVMAMAMAMMPQSQRRWWSMATTFSSASL